MTINNTFVYLEKRYLFSEIASRVAEYRKSHPGADILPLGIGDVTLPLAEPMTKALIKASAEMGTPEGFHGYAPDGGYPFLRRAIASYYARLGVSLSPEEIFVSDGAKTDLGAIGEIFEGGTAVLSDPIYPVFYESSLLAGRPVVLLTATEKNGYRPMPDALSEKESYLIYLCSPNNPTGVAYSSAELQQWVDFARRSGSLILFDACYEAYLSSDGFHSILEADGAETCAVEIGSFSKKAGFTGLRCSYTIVSNRILLDGRSVREAWARRQSVKFNGVSYPVERAAEAALSREGIASWRKQVDYYRENARILAGVLTEKGIPFVGGKDSPYLWLSCGKDSWQFFSELLDATGIVGTPGVGFGKAGEGFFRLSSFGSRETMEKAAERFYTFL